MSALLPYTGVYRLGGNRRLGIERFISDTGESTLLFSDYQTGLVRPLFRVSHAEFAMGPHFTVRSPIELTVRFQMDGQGAARGLTVQPAGGAATFAEKVPSRDEEVVFRHGDTSLAGTFIVPATPGPHPAIVLLHGSGPLTRHSFGPWPRFFNSLGLAVLVYDKRGTGASTGVRLDASTGAPKTLPPRYYPDDLADDALAAFRCSDFTSLEQMRWAWKHVLAFSPLPELRRVTCPVLGVWGEADPLTDAPKAASAMRETLSEAGNTDVTVKVFPHASHSLMETPSRKGMAPGVFDYLQQWLLARVRLPHAR